MKHWPYGADDPLAQKRLLEWAAARKVTYSVNGCCLHWIAHGRCGVSFCLEGHGSHPWMDHVSGWVAGGKPAILLAQPYSISTNSMTDIAATAEKFGLDISVDGRGWYSNGTVSIEIRRKPNPP